jgi:periplasmic protein CpxP/Spy
MKKFLLLGSLFFSIVTITFAQQGPNQEKQAKTPQEKAAHQTKKWTKDLGLNATQSGQIEPIFLQQDQQIESIRTKYASATDKKAQHTEIKAVHDQTDASLKQVLTPEQYTQYTNIKAQKKAEHKNNH